MAPASLPGPASLSRSDGQSEAWLGAFHAGEREAIEGCYRDHFATVSQAVGRVLLGADKETVVHEVFFRLLSDADLRRNFRGGSLSGWLLTVARNQAVDYQRRARRERPLEEAPPGTAEGESRPPSEEDLDARRFVEAFRREHLPPKWEPVFEARFLRQLSQREAARALGMSRTTLAYQELRIRRLLRRAALRRRSR